MDQIVPKCLKPVLQGLPRRAGGNVVHHHFQIGMVDLLIHAAGPLQTVDQIALVLAEGLHHQQDTLPPGRQAQPAQVIPASAPHGGLILPAVTPAGVDHDPVRAQLGRQMDGVGEVPEGPLQKFRLLGGILILIGYAGRRDGHHPDIVRGELGTERIDIAESLMIQPEVGRAAPELDLLYAQALLAVQKVV